MSSSPALVAKLTGTMTALVTPMDEGGAIDVAAMDRLVDRQLAAGIGALVVNGSTAEAITLSAQERQQILSRIVARVRGRALVIAGTGHSSTQNTLVEHEAARAAGADAGLVVTPPYNRPSDEGLWRHYQAISKASSLPVLLYNVASRTGRDMSVPLIARLSSLPGVVGLKDANVDLSRVTALRRQISRPFALLSGDDQTAGAYCAIGGDGLISVASNACPKTLSALVHAARHGEREALVRHQLALAPLLDALSLDGNPVPIKAAVALQDQQAPHYRLPLCEAKPEVVDAVRAALQHCHE